MFYKYLGLNKITIGFLILICMLLIRKYQEIVQLHNSLLIIEEDNVIEQYENNNDDENNSVYAIQSNIRRILKIKRFVNRRNARQFVRNRNQDQVVRTGTTIIVIEVRSNTIYLKTVIESLRQVTGIINSLLIFSHATFDEEVNEVVRNISFAKYIQIYYPFSVQLNPDVFPGDDSKFCRYDLSCINNGGRRNATLLQGKHHWWWRTSFVFDRLRVTKDFNGTIIFLDENQCVAADVIYILKMLEKLRPKFCTHCEILNLGSADPNITQYHLIDATMIVSKLGATQELMGMAFNRSVWNIIKNVTKHFCEFNDINWTRSLIYAASRIPHEYHVLTIEGPRVFRFGRCSLENEECGDLDRVEFVQAFMSKIKRGLFPRNMSIRMNDRNVNVSAGHGGWDDARDRELCKYFTRISRFERHS